MEHHSDEKKMVRETLLIKKNPKGGLRTLPFIIGNYKLASNTHFYLCTCVFIFFDQLWFFFPLFWFSSWTANEAFENMASNGLMPSMSKYLVAASKSYI